MSSKYSFTRENGRKPDEVRDITIKFDGLARVDGCARFGFGKDAQALASISGPVEVRLASENASQATLEVHLRPLTNVPGTESKTLASHISSALIPSLILTQNPRSLVQVIIQTLEPSSPCWKDYLVPSMINASTLALMNAGSVPMKGVVCSVFVGRIAGSTEYIVDPAVQELSNLDAGGCFAFMFAHGHGSGSCVWTNWRSIGGTGFDENEIVTTRNLARAAAAAVLEEMKEAVNMMGNAVAAKIKQENTKLETDEDDAKMEI